jgi:diguanylate cyclase (GGDEF)-like protein
MRHASSIVIAAFPILFLAAHAGTLALAREDQAMAASFAWLIAAPVAAGLACLYRGWREGFEGWLPLGAAMLCWAGGMTTTMVATLFFAITSEDRLSMLLYVLYGVPLIFALASPEDEKWHVRLVDALLACALGYLFYHYVNHLSTASGTQPGKLDALKLMFDIENGYIALFAMMRFVARPGPRYGFFRATLAYAVAYLLCAGYINHFEAASDYGHWADLVIDLPFTLLAGCALAAGIGRATRPATRPLAFTRVVRAGSPLAIPVSLLTVSVLLVAHDPKMAITGCVAASLGYGLRTVLVQLRNFEEQDKLTRLSHLDALTGIPNRRRFDEVLQREWQRRDRMAGHLALLMIDIDHFKQLNDRFGHSIGDDRLRAVALALAECARREGDLIARHGGEEFAAVLTDIAPQDAAVVAERMRASVEALALPLEAPGSASPSDGSVRVTVSIGIACAQPLDADLEAFVAHADAALYDAKRGGRNRIVHHATPLLRVVGSGGGKAA